MKKRITAWLCLILMMTGLLCGCGGNTSKTPANQTAPEDLYTVFARVPEDWEDIRIWAWSDTKGDLFEVWPGERMNNEGNGWYSYVLPQWVDEVIINGNGGTIQTADLAVEPQKLWIQVNADTSATISYSKPAEPVPQTGYYPIYAKVNTGWYDVSAWVWSDTEGDLYEAWPGTLMELGTDGWYVLEVPEGYDNVVINGNGGTAQTEDLRTGGTSVWITVDQNGTSVSNSKPSASAAPAVPEETEFDRIFSSRGIQDIRVVDGSLRMIAGAAASDTDVQKYEYGHAGKDTIELSITLYMDITGWSDAQIQAGKQMVQENYGDPIERMDSAMISSDQMGNYIRYIMYFWNLDNPANARQLAEFIGADSSQLTAEGLIPVPTVYEMESSGFTVKVE